MYGIAVFFPLLVLSRQFQLDREHILKFCEWEINEFCKDEQHKLITCLFENKHMLRNTCTDAMRNTQLMSCMDHIEICTNDEIKGRRNTMSCLLKAVESGDLELSPNDLCLQHLRGIGVTEMEYTPLEPMRDETTDDVMVSQIVEALPENEGGNEDMVRVSSSESDQSIEFIEIESPQWISEMAHIVLMITKICFYALVTMCCCLWKPWNRFCCFREKKNSEQSTMELEPETEDDQDLHDQWTDSDGIE